MKKLYLLLLIAFVALASTAQTTTFNSILEKDGFFSYTTDATLTNAVARVFILPAFKGVPTTQDFYIKLDSLAGNHTNVAVSFWGSKFSDAPYAQIGATVNWKGTTADTAIVISNATANRYSLYKWIITGTGTGTTTIDLSKLILYK